MGNIHFWEKHVATWIIIDNFILHTVCKTFSAKIVQMVITALCLWQLNYGCYRKAKYLCYIFGMIVVVVIHKNVKAEY